MEAAGNVTVQITGNIAPFEAALAKAQQMAVAFDAKISAQLNGAGLSEGLAKIADGIDVTNSLLTKLTTSGAAAGAALSKVAASTTATTEALGAVAVATKAVNAEMASIAGSGGGAAALEAGAISAKEFAAALEATGGRLDKITPAMLGLATGTETVAAANTTAARSATAVAAGNEEIAVSSRTAAAGMETLGAAETRASGLGAGVTREFSVLGSEIARGNFSRIPGSLIVLNERLVSTGTGVLTLANGMKALGGLASAVFNPFTLGFLAISLGADVAIRALASIGSGVKDVNTILKDHKALIEEITAAYPTAAAAAKAYDDQAAKIPTSVAAADTVKQIEEEQKKVKALTFDLSNSLTVLGNDYTAFGSAGSAAFVKLGEDLKSGAKTASDVQQTLGDLRIDPSLNKNAHEFATYLQESATEAANLELHLAGAVAAGNVFKGSTVGRGDEGANILANMVEAGNAAAEALKKVQDSLRVTGQTPYAASIANINREFDAAIIKAHAAGAALDTFNQARNLSIQEASLKALGGVTFDTPIAGADKLGIALTTAGQAADHVKVSIGGISAPIVNMTQLLGAAKLDQLLGVESAANQLEEYKVSLTHVKELLETVKGTPGSFFGDAFKGTQADISGAFNAIDNVFKLFDTGNASVKAVHDRIEEVRATLIALGGDEASVKQYITDIVNGEAKTRQLNSDVQTLGHSIATLPNKTVTITVVTKQVGSGTQSIYDVPNSSGGTSGVGVTRYGGVAGQQSGPSVSAYSVPSTGYGSQGGGGESPTGTVNVTRFATGGIIHPGDSQKVSFFKNPAETVGIFTPGQMDALANPQSAFTGTQATANDNRVWTVLMNVEANTRKSAQLLDEIKTSMASSSSSLGGSSYGGSSAGANSDPLAAQYMDVLRTIKSNLHAAGIVGGGQIGYGSNGLGATPEQIARKIVYGGQSSVGTPTSYSDPFAQSRNYVSPTARAALSAMNPRDPGYAAAYASVYGSGGFNSGGMIAPGDTQEVKFFKSPDEAVAIFTPQQLKAIQGANQNQPAAANADGRPIVVNQTHNWNGNAPPSKDSIAEMRRQTALAVREALRSINGR